MILATLVALSLSADPVGLKVEPTFSLPNDAAFLALADVKITASSTLCEGKGAKKTCHSADRLMDGKVDTAWCEGVKDKGDGETLTFEFTEPRELVAIEFQPYYGKDFRRAVQNGRPSELTTEINGTTYVIELEDLVWNISKSNGAKPKPPPCGDESCVSQDEAIAAGPSLTAVFPKGVKAKQFKLSMDLANSGDKYPDTCMSSLRIAVKKGK